MRTGDSANRTVMQNRALLPVCSFFQGSTCVSRSRVKALNMSPTTTPARRIGPTRASTMTERSITDAVFYNAHPGDHRGLTDAFTESGIQAVASNEDAGKWSDRAIDYLCA